MWRTGTPYLPMAWAAETSLCSVSRSPVRGTQGEANEERSTMYIGGGVLALILIILLLIWLF